MLLALRRINQAIRRYVETSEVKQELDHLTGSNGWILGFLADHEGEDIYQRDIEKQLGMCRSAVSKTVAALEKTGCIERARVASDDRLKKLVLTERGKAFTGLIRADTYRLEEKLTSGFSETELEQLRSLLRRMEQNLSGEN